jgi:perosamine synthetase
VNTSFEPGSAPEGFIPLSVPVIRGREWEYVKECLDTGWVSSVGGFVNRFEDGVKAVSKSAAAVAMVNGTASLHVALRIAGVEESDEVLMPALTFIAPANAVRYLGAWPRFFDVDPETWQMDVGLVSRYLRTDCVMKDGSPHSRDSGRRIRALLPVHILGAPVDMTPLLELAREFSMKVIEDATESLGAKYKGIPIGSLGDMGCFSFNGNKLITTGGGGMLVTDNAEWALKARYLSTQAKDDPLEYDHHEIGYNYRLTNIQAAIGCAQLEQLGEYIAAKRRIFKRYQTELADLAGISFQKTCPEGESIRWLTTICVNPDKFGADSRTLLRRLADSRIQSRPLWRPLYMLPPYCGCAVGNIPVAERLYLECLSLPSSVNLSDNDQDRVIRAMRCAVRGTHA